MANKSTKISMEEVLDELQSRFLMNLPASELASTDRLFFQIEQCYWFYEDFYADHYTYMRHMKLNDFAKKIFNHCVLLQPLKHKCETMFADFRAYQNSIPVVGCIMLNQMKTKLLLVRNWKGTSWTFPRGKINQDEEDVECAAREALEECGYDASAQINPEAYIEMYLDEQRARMYIISDVPEDFHFAPQTRKEISLIQFFDIESLPKKTWSVLPFLSRLKRWIKSDGKKGSSHKSNSKKAKGQQRSSSAPKTRPQAQEKSKTNNSQKAAKTSQHEKYNTHDSNGNPRSVSTPHTRPVIKKRGHFGTETQTSTSSDVNNGVTFGEATAADSFSVEEMFQVNEKLTGQKFEYDGNPHDFGSVKKTTVAVQHAASEVLVAPVLALFQNFENSVSSEQKSKVKPADKSTLKKPPSDVQSPLLKFMIPPTSSSGDEKSSSQLPLSTSSMPPLHKTSATTSINDDDLDEELSCTFEFDTMDIMSCVN